MAKNSYFKDVSSENDLLHDLTIETIKIHGRDMVYIPRTLVNEDELFSEDTISKFENGVEVEMYINSVDGFGGDGDFISKFGLEIRDTVELVVSKRRFEESFSHDSSIIRPREGDLIFFPLSKGLFEIKFVEHENPFYQLGKLYTYKLSCELFVYSNEDIDSGFSEIDSFDDDRKTLAVDLSIGSYVSGALNFFDGETVYQGDSLALATATAVVVDWNSTTKILKIDEIKGRTDPNADDLIANKSAFSSGTNVKGDSSGAIYALSSTADSDLIVTDDEYNNSSIIERELDSGDIIDFTDKDPFSEGNY
tara:strand:+ start:1496 stop:2419 length:924 start_codon:yes stop_codon:yes gene_type:complete